MPSSLAPREDARADAHCRALVVALDVVPAAAGSAYVELGDTKASCAVYGPRRGRAELAGVDRGTLDVDAYRAPFATGARALDGANRGRARGRGARTADDGLARTVKEALSASVLTESFPKTQVDACVTVLDARGGEAVACVLAASAALARAGVACRDLVSACECARAGERMMLDPTREEIETSDGMVFLAQMSSMEAYAKTETFGRWNADETERALDACAAGCNRFDAVLREALRANPRD
jgi:ribonuclease PH